MYGKPELVRVDNGTEFSRIAAPLMAAAVRRANQKDLARLRSSLEKR
jgi:hypothetical protein